METLTKKSGIKSYREKIYENGRPVNGPCFSRKADAHAWKRRKLTERETAKALGVKPRKEITFEQFLTLWNERRLATLAINTKVRYLGFQRNFLIPHWGGMGVQQITKEAVADFGVSLRSAGVSATTIDLVIAYLRTLLAGAVEWEYLPSNPAKGIKPTAENMVRSHYWEEHEVQQFLSASKADSLHSLYLFALLTGMRRAELAGLKWGAVSFATNNISVCRIRDRYGERETTKSGKRREIPMNTDIRRLLGELHKARTGEYVFERPDGRPLDIQHIYRAFTKSQQKAGIEKIIHFHDLRHTFASIFLMRGGNLNVLAKLMGHSQLSMTERYGHIAQSHATREMEKMCFSSQSRVNSPDLAQESAV